MTIVNNREVLDSVGLFELADRHVDLARSTVDAANDLDLGVVETTPRSVVVCGMGGSGIAGDVLAAVAADRATVPVGIVKDFDLPAFVGAETLVFAVSYGGTTEETLAATRAALDSEATVIAVTAGGLLGDIADERGLPRIPVPWGAQPRAMLAAQVLPIIVVCERLGLIPGAGDDVAEAVERIETCIAACSATSPEDKNPALAIARRLDRRVPLVYGTPGPAAVAAYRWKCQINQNAKAPAFWNVYPELDHTEICGWGQHGDITRQMIALVQLHGDREPDPIERRLGATAELVEEVVADIVDVATDAGTPLGRFFDLALTGDYVSLFLAALAEVDPGPIEVVDRLRETLVR